MVRLDKSRIRSSLKRSSSNEEASGQETTTMPEPSDSSSSKTGSEIDKFSQYVLKQLIEESVPPTPSNFQIYFDKLLESRPLSFRQRINDLLESENANDDEHRAMIEKEVKEGFGKIKHMLQSIASVYKNISTMKNLVKKRLGELNVNSNHLAVQNIITAFEDDLQKLSSIMEKQLGVLKQNYDSAGEVLKTIEQEAIFDSRYGVYNKKHLLKTIEKELAAIDKFNYSNTLMALKIKDKVLNKILNTKDRAILLRNIAKLLLKTSRRSDVVAHYGEGIFTMVMKHTNIENAKKACDRIADLIYATSFFIGEIELDIDIELSVLELASGKTPEESIIATLDALQHSGKQKEIYTVASYASNSHTEDEE